MRPLRHAAALLLLALPALSAGGKADVDLFVPQFNGKDLSGWVNVNCAPGTFFVKDGELITTGRPTGYLRTIRQYENFIAEFDWMHVNKTEVGNSGFFVWADPLPGVGTPYTRGIEVQVLVNLEKEGYYTSQGDLFSIQGASCVPDRPHPHGWARCLPSENRCKGGGEWNHYKVIGDNGTLKLHVNGKEVSGLSQCKPRKGYLALESEGAECHFRNLQIKELPSTNPKPDEVADEAKGFKNLYTGLDLSGWKVDDAAKKDWQPRDSVLHYESKVASQDAALRSEKEYGDCEFIADFRFPATGGRPCVFGLHATEKGGLKLKIEPSGAYSVSMPMSGFGSNQGAGLKPAQEWNRLHVTLKDSTLHLTVNGKGIPAPARISPAPSAKGALVLQPQGTMDFENLFIRELK